MKSTARALILFSTALLFAAAVGGAAPLSDAQVTDIVTRSYPYFAMYNLNNKFAMNQGGWSTCVADRLSSAAGRRRATRIHLLAQAPKQRPEIQARGGMPDCQ